MARRIEEMVCDVSQQVIEKIKQDKRFALQLDESTDISNQAQLLMYVCCCDEDMKSDLKVHFLDEEWVFQLSYLADVFSKIKELNLQGQGFDVNIFQAHDKVKGFYKKVLFWITQVEKGDIATFESLSNLIIENEVVLTGRVMIIISNHLTILANTFLKYIPEIALKDLTNT
ncbi:Zinc finger BED domain-containing protein 5-like [Oopsacas minuta]|uniref:Zinc finger BED domain-containing protein 5-like n=1 Tax=Oopsacas minuta TaxID=111878 RepID=A0AAV7JM91_9METZ|nr:Zinc finger BED domain-containing protein 5-like [Oopsacas minuta]